MTQISDMAEDEAASPDALDDAAETTSLHLSGVYLLTAESEGQTAVPGLGIDLDHTGLTVRKPDGQVGVAVGWAQLSSVTAGGRMRTPVGTPGVVLEAATAGRTHRFVVPTLDPDALEGDIARVVSTMPRDPRSKVRRRLARALVGLFVVVAAAGVTLAALVATGTVKF
jgi:hypothetical protein